MNRKEGHNDFNIYYMNFSKVYEIAMMINNQIVKSYQREKGQQIEDTYSLDSLIEAKGDVNFLTSIKSSMTSKETLINIAINISLILFYRFSTFLYEILMFAPFYLFI